MAAIQSLTEETQVDEFFQKHTEAEVTIYTVHSIQRPINDGFETSHDSWIVHKNREEAGSQTESKKNCKEEARSLAKENPPAIILFETREAEVHRAELITNE